MSSSREARWTVHYSRDARGVSLSRDWTAEDSVYTVTRNSGGVYGPNTFEVRLLADETIVYPFPSVGDALDAIEAYEAADAEQAAEQTKRVDYRNASDREVAGLVWNPVTRKHERVSATAEPVEMTVKTPEIREGDIVLSHGMRILIEGPAHVFHGHCVISDSSREDDGDMCLLGYAWPGKVLNVEEVMSAEYRAIPRSFLYDTERQIHGPGHGREDTWNVQGNYRATWRVLRTLS